MKDSITSYLILFIDMNIKGFILYLGGKTKLRAFAFSTLTTTRHVTTTTSVPSQNKNTITLFMRNRRNKSHCSILHMVGFNTLTCHYKVLSSEVSMKRKVHYNQNQRQI